MFLVYINDIWLSFKYNFSKKVKLLNMEAFFDNNWLECKTNIWRVDNPLKMSPSNLFQDKSNSWRENSPVNVAVFIV